MRPMPSRPDYPAFSRLIRAALGDRTQTWLAERLGITQQHASDIVNGKHRPPRRMIEAMAEHLALEGAKREAFVEEAYLTHVPEFIRARLARLEQQLVDSQKQGAKNADELATLIVEVSQLQRQAADLVALRAAVASLVKRHPELLPELRALVAAPVLGLPDDAGRR